MNTPTSVNPTIEQQGQQGAFPLAAGSAFDDALIRYHESFYGKRPPGMSREELLDVLRRWESTRVGAQQMLSRRAMRKRVKAHAERHAALLATDLFSPNVEISNGGTPATKSHE